MSETPQGAAVLNLRLTRLEGAMNSTSKRKEKAAPAAITSPSVTSSTCPHITWVQR